MPLLRSDNRRHHPHIRHSKIYNLKYQLTILEGDQYLKKTPDSRICQWCGKEFDPRCDGGKPQVFCRPACRREFDTARRRR